MDTTKLKGLWERIKGFFTKLNKKVRILLGVAAAVTLIAIVAIIIEMNNRPYVELVTGLSNTEASSIMTFLEENGVTDYQVQGDTILVPKAQATQLQAQMLLAGYPRSGFLFESYRENVSMTSTNSERETELLLATTEKIEAIIRQFEGVQEAYVLINTGEDQTFVLNDSKIEASASVTIVPSGTTRLSNQVANAIRTAVAQGIEGLQIANVSIGDTLGNTYSGSDNVSALSEGSALKLQLEEEVNNKVRTNILQALGDVYGLENINVAVSSVVDVSRKIVESTSHAQPEGSVDGAGLIGSETWLYQLVRDGEGLVGGAVGTTANSEIPEYVEDALQATGDEDYASHSGDRDYEIDETREQMEVIAGTVTDISVSVTINESSINASAVNLEALRNHVAMASGIGGEDPVSKVSILVAPFYEEPLDTENVLTPEQAIGLAIIGAGLLVLLIIILIISAILRKRRKKKQKALEQQQAEEAALAAAAAAAAAAAGAQTPAGGADIMELNTEKSMELRKAVRQFAQNNPEIAAQMVKAWLKGDEDNG